MSRFLRWLPVALIGTFLGMVLIWTVTQPLEDMRASLVGFLLAAIGCAALVPALHLAIEQ